MSNILIDTGDNQRKGKDAMTQAKQYLVKFKGCTVIRDLWDETSKVFGFEAADVKGQHFYCAARSTPPMQQGIYRIVSCQKRLVAVAKKELKPIVLMYPLNQVIVFDAHMIHLNNFGVNKRENIDFLNFSPNLGLTWFSDNIMNVWRQLQYQKRGDLRTFTGEPK